MRPAAASTRNDVVVEYQGRLAFAAHGNAAIVASRECGVAREARTGAKMRAPLVDITVTRPLIDRDRVLESPLGYDRRTAATEAP